VNLTIEIPENIASELNAQASAQGISAARLASRVIEETLARAIARENSGQPFETGRDVGEVRLRSFC
jgi:hypothetical protein